VNKEKRTKQKNKRQKTKDKRLFFTSKKLEAAA
jgi:hypothetical protein